MNKIKLYFDGLRNVWNQKLRCMEEYGAEKSQDETAPPADVLALLPDAVISERLQALVAKPKTDTVSDPIGGIHAQWITISHAMVQQQVAQHNLQAYAQQNQQLQNMMTAPQQMGPALVGKAVLVKNPSNAPIFEPGAPISKIAKP